MRLFSLALVVFLSTSCSFRKLAFRNADWIANYEADRFFDPKGEQTKQMGMIADTALARARSHYLPQAHMLLNEFKTNAADGMSEKEWQQLFTQGHQIRREAMSELLKLGAPFLVTLSDKQLKNLQEELEETNEDLLELVEAKKFDKRMLKRQMRTVGLYKDLLGSVTDEQKEIILKNTHQSREQIQQFLTGRREMQKNFVALIRQHRDVASLQKELQQWIDDPKTIGSAAYEEARLRRSERHNNLVRELEVTLSPKQREHMLAELSDWMDDVEALKAG